jgi:hypothetical protein
MSRFGLWVLSLMMKFRTKVGLLLSYQIWWRHRLGALPLLPFRRFAKEFGSQRDFVMTSTELQPVADAVLRLAKRQSFVTSREVRAELRIAGLAEQAWKEVLALIHPSLISRQGRFYHKDGFSPRVQKEHDQQHAIQKVIRKLIKEHRNHNKRDERRGQARVDFIQPVKVRTDDGKEFTLISRDLSATGVRLLGTKRLLGQKVQLDLPGADGVPLCRLLVRILWTCAVGDDLFENGGTFVELLE